MAEVKDSVLGVNSIDYSKVPGYRKVESKEETKSEIVTKKVIDGKAKIKEPNAFKKIFSSLIADDLSKIKSYILDEVIIPSIKDTLHDIINNGTDMILYGQEGRRTARRSSSSFIQNNNRVAYNDISTRNANNSPRLATKSTVQFGDVIVNTRAEAEQILDVADELISQGQVVRVSDLYESAGITPVSTAVNYGWYDIHSAKIVRSRDGGYIIEMPRAELIER